MRMKICDEDDHCCLTAENLHSQFGNDRERGDLDVYDQIELLGNCKNVKFHIFHSISSLKVVTFWLVNAAHEVIKM